MRLLPGRQWAVPVTFLVGAVPGLYLMKSSIVVGLIAGGLFGLIAVVVTLSFYSRHDSRLLRLLELLPKTIVVNVHPTPSTRRLLPRLEGSDRSSSGGQVLSLAIDGDTVSFWGGSRSPQCLARIPWEMIEDITLGQEVGRSRWFSLRNSMPHPQVALLVRDGGNTIRLQFAVLALPGEEPDGLGGYVDVPGIELLIHYAKARRHGTMPPRPAQKPVARRVPLRTLVVPIAVGASILIAFGAVVAMGLSNA